MLTYESLCIYWKWPSKIQRFQVWFVLTTCFIINLALGVLYTYGNLSPYIVSYIRQNSHPNNLRYHSAPFVFACQLIGQCAGMIVGGILERKFGPRMVMFIGSVIMCLGVLFTSLAVKVSFYLMLVTYGLAFGTGLGLAYICPLVCIMKWLPKWKGLASGIVLAGDGLSALIFVSLQTIYINPDNLSPNSSPYENHPSESYFTQPELLDRVPNVFLVQGGILAAMQFLSCIFVVNPIPPEEDEHKQEKFALKDISTGTSKDLQSQDNSESTSGDETSKDASPIPKSQSPRKDSDKGPTSISSVESSLSANQVGEDATASDKEVNETDVIDRATSLVRDILDTCKDITPVGMFKQLNFYLIWIMFLLGGVCYSFVITLYKSFAFVEVTTDDYFLFLVGSISAIFNMLGRIVWGLVADWTDYKFALTIQGGVMSILLLTFYSTSVTGKEAFLIWMCALFFCVGGYLSLFPMATASCFGEAHMGTNYGIMYSALVVANILMAFLAHILRDLFPWYGLIYTVAASSTVYLFGGIFITFKK